MDQSRRLFAHDAGAQQCGQGSVAVLPLALAGMAPLSSDSRLVGAGLSRITFLLGAPGAGCRRDPELPASQPGRLHVVVEESPGGKGRSLQGLLKLRLGNHPVSLLLCSADHIEARSSLDSRCEGINPSSCW